MNTEKGRMYMEKAEKILSVSIAAYNVESTLKEVLEPFVECRYLENLDIMIIDDGSKDNTANIAEEYVDRFPNTFRLIKKENGGWGSTLNTGMSAAVGKYFKQLDGDDYYSKENLDDFIEFLSICNSDLVYSPFITFEDQTGAIIRVLGTYQMYPQRQEMHLSELENFAPAMHTLTVRTDILQNNPIQITEHCFYTDVEFVLKSCNFSNTIVFYEYPIYYYRLARSGQSMSIEGVRKHYQDHLKMVLTMLQYEQKYVTKPFMKKMFFLRLSGACQMQYVFFFGLECNRKQKQELKKYDQELKEKYPKYYKSIQGRRILLLRKLHFMGYWFIGHQATKKDKKLKINIFEG